MASCVCRTLDLFTLMISLYDCFLKRAYRILGEAAMGDTETYKLFFIGCIRLNIGGKAY